MPQRRIKSVQIDILTLFPQMFQGPFSTGIFRRAIDNKLVDVRIYNIIYEAVNDIKAAMEGMLEPVVEETFLGRAEVREIFKVSKVGIVAGCFVLKGRIPRDATCRLIRNKDVIFKGKISSLKHFKDDIKEAKEGFECGISLSFRDIKKGDIIEAFEIRKVARRLK